LVNATGQFHPLASSTSALCEKFGDRLTLFRDGDVVQWSFDGQSATVELGLDGTIAANFIDRPQRDAVSGEFVSAVYRRNAAPYRVCAEGCARMVADMDDFFTGTREGRFTFVAISP
jgi:hypothetical protein